MKSPNRITRIGNAHGRNSGSNRVWLTILLLGLSLGCSSQKASKQEPVVPVQVATVRRMKIQQEIATEAVIFPIHEATIVPKISAPVSKFYVERGEHVQTGQLLALLDNRDLIAAVAESKGAYEQAQANYENATGSNLPEQIQMVQQDLKNAQAAFEAAQHLYESSKTLYEQGALAKEHLDQAQVGLVQAKSQLTIAEQHLQKLQSVGEQAQKKAAEGELDAAKGKYESARAELAYSEIRSPIAGVVTDRPLYPGGMAAAGSPLITVIDTSQIVARSHLPDSQAELLKDGDPAQLSEIGENNDFPGTVTLVSPALHPDSTTVEVWVQAPNPGRQLKPGETVNLTVIATSIPNALTVPESALVRKPNQGTFVMVVGRDDRARQREVQTGIQEGDNVEITKGLEDGELVVTAGVYGLPDGAKVKLQRQEGNPKL